MSLIGRGFKVKGSGFVLVTPDVDRKERRLFVITVAPFLCFQVH